jgi:septal ring factor EnvC (AmiA/AmiB activator)
VSEVTREEFDKLSAQVQRNTERLANGDTALALIDKELKHINNKLDELTASVNALKEKPAKRWESVSTTIIQWVVTALLAFIAVKIGLN